jgi:transcription antitermination factor NusG
MRVVCRRMGLPIVRIMVTANQDLLWYALTVKPNHERAAAQALECKGLETFLPLYRSRRRWSDRFKELDLPLFAGYVFCRFQGTDRGRILSTPGINSVVGFGNRPAAVAEREIEAVRAMVASGLPVGPWPFLKVGEKVRIEAGPLAGVEGILSQVKDRWRVVVSVELLQRSVAAEVDREVISVVTRCAPAAGERARRESRGRSPHARS